MNERGSHVLLVLLLLAHLVLLSNQGDESSRLEGWLLAAFGPVSRAVTGTVDKSGDVASSWRSASSLRLDNERLHTEAEAMRQELARLHGIEEELSRLSRATSYSRAAEADTFVADVVLIDPVSWLRTLVIYTGKEKPERNQPVINDRGLVGRIVVPAGRYAEVQLITDRSSSVSAMIKRSRRQGLVQGDGVRGLRLDNIPTQAEVRVGDRVVTAGLDGVFPRGLPIGEVTTIDENQGLFQRIRLAPAVDFGLLDQVYVLTREPLPEALKGERLIGDPRAGDVR